MRTLKISFRDGEYIFKGCDGYTTQHGVLDTWRMTETGKIVDRVLYPLDRIASIEEDP